jgi:branched-chain amino acid transport system ATP-binding protein
MIYLQTWEITAGYGRVPVVEDVSITAESGKVTALVGPNGAGKSTLLKAICGLLPMAKGRVEVIGQDVSRLSTHLIARTGLGYVPQVNNVFESLSVLENLEMGAIATGRKSTTRAGEVLAIFPDLQAAQRKPGGDLSGGQRNMLAIARALMMSPKVLLLDEPTAGLAPQVSDQLWQQVRTIAQNGTAILIVEQNVDAVLTNADWMYVLVGGRRRRDGTPQDIPRDELIGLFLGGETNVAVNVTQLEGFKGR